MLGHTTLTKSQTSCGFFTSVNQRFQDFVLLNFTLVNNRRKVVYSCQ